MFLCSLKEAEKPFCERLHRVRDLMDRSKVSIEEVISELGQYLMIFDLISRLLRGFSLFIFFWCPVSIFYFYCFYLRLQTTTDCVNRNVWLLQLSYVYLTC